MTGRHPLSTSSRVLQRQSPWLAARRCWPLAVVFIGLSMGVPAAGQSPVPGVILASSTGAARVRRGGAPVYTAATRHMTLGAGDIVRTGPNGGAVLLFPDGSQIKLGPNSAVLIPTISPSLGPDRLQLQEGRLFARVAPGSHSRFEAGRTAVAGVRGTQFDLRLAAGVVPAGRLPPLRLMSFQAPEEPLETATLTVVEGEVDFGNAQGAVHVSERQQSVARAGEAPSRPQVVDPSGIIAWEASVEALSFPIETPLVPPGDLSALLSQRERAVAATPRDASAMVALGDIRQERGELEEAATAYDRALALQPDLLAAQANRAQLDLRAGRLEAARGAYERLAAVAPRSAEGPLGIGMTHLVTGDAAGAEPALEQADALDPTGPRPPTFLGVARLRSGDVAGAEALWRRAISREESYYPAHAYLSLALTLGGKGAAAEAEGRRAVALAPYSALAHEALANALFYGGQPEAAQREIEEALSKNPLSATARLTEAKILVATDRLPEGVRAAQQAVALDPNNPQGHTTLGVMLLAQNNGLRAEQEFRRAVALGGNAATAETGLGAVYAQRGELRRALDQQKAALALDSSSAGAHNNLGAVYLAQGNLSTAIEEFRQAAALQPRWGLPHANLAQAYLEENRFAEAVEEAERAVQLGEQSAILHTTLARVYARQGRLDRALAELRLAEAIDPAYPQAQFQLSRIYLQQNRDRDALRAILWATSVHPGAMVEDRLYARTEATLSGGSQALSELDGKTDGRALEGTLSHFLSGTHSQTESDRPVNGDQRQTFAEGLLGLERSPAHEWLFFGSRLHQNNGRPGRQIDGRVDDRNFRSDSDGWETHLLHRLSTGLRSHLTLKVGQRDSELLDRNPDAATEADPKPFRRLDTRLKQTLAEARWDAALSRRDRLTAGFAWRDESQSLEGQLGVVDTNNGLVFQPTHNRQDTAERTLYGEWVRRAGERLDLKLGGTFGKGAGAPRQILPKLLARYRPSGGSYLVFLAYPRLQTDVTELSPVEAWAQPFGFDQLDLGPQGWVMSYELHYERPTSRLSLLSLAAFMRNARDLFLDLEDPRFAPTPVRSLAARARIRGGQAALERTLTRQLSGRVFLQYQESENRDTGENLPYLERWQSGVRLDYLDRAGWRSFLALRYVGPRAPDRETPGSDVTDPRNRPDLPGYTVLDARLSRQLDLRHNLFVEIDNLLDRHYELFRGYPAAGRQVLGGVEYRF